MPLTLAFMGTPPFAVPTLEALVAAGHRIAAVYTQPPRPAGRGQKLQKSAVHEAAERLGLEVRTPLSLKDADGQAAFAGLGADAAVVVAYGLLLPRPVLEAVRLGCFNLHGSLLPRWRGAAPIERAILAGDAETGVQVMRMEEGLDTGPVLATARLAIGPAMTAGMLREALAVRGAGLMIEALAALEAGTAEEVPQRAEGVTYAKKILKDEARLDWSESAEALDRRIRAFLPSPGAWFEVAGERVKVLRARAEPGRGAPGEVVESGGSLVVAAGDGVLRLLDLQRAGGKPLAAADFLRGFPLPEGTRLP